MQQSKTSATVLTRASGEYAHCVPEDLSALEPKRLIPQIRKQVVAEPDEWYEIAKGAGAQQHRFAPDLSDSDPH